MFYCKGWSYTLQWVYWEYCRGILYFYSVILFVSVFLSVTTLYVTRNTHIELRHTVQPNAQTPMLNAPHINPVYNNHLSITPTWPIGGRYIQVWLYQVTLSIQPLSDPISEVVDSGEDSWNSGRAAPTSPRHNARQTAVTGERPAAVSLVVQEIDINETFRAY